ncbi:hypothetical protein [Desulfarculus baarsii]|nr:hypothetical protein [Desulfarculus baarsii]
MSKDNGFEVVRVIAAERPELARRFGAKSIGVFGWCARGGSAR